MTETKRIARMGMLTALSLLLSYVESLLPSFFAVPGIKLGLANTAVVFALYTLTFPDALLVSIMRVLISSLLFGNVLSLLYSFSGALLSLVVMALVKKTGVRVQAVSITGGIVHNTTQLLVAMAVVKSTALRYYLPFLLLSGVITGFAIGEASSLILVRLSSSGEILSDGEKERMRLVS